MRALAARLPHAEMLADVPYETCTCIHSHTPVAVCRCGIGKVPAAGAAQWMADRFSPAAIILCGVAGALVEDLHVGDIVVAEELIPVDCGIWSSSQLCFTGVMSEGEAGLQFTGSFAASGALLSAASIAAEEMGAGEKMRVLPGRVVTCDQATFCQKRRRELAEKFSACAVEMEGAAVAQVAELNGIPFLALRGVSDDICFDPLGEPFGVATNDVRLAALHDPVALAAGRAAELSLAIMGHLA